MNKKITVLVFSLEHGGAEKVCVTLCNEFVKLNYQTELWVVNSNETVLTLQLDKRIKTIWLNKKHVRNSVFKMLKLLLKHKPEKVLVFHIELAILLIVLTKLLFLKTQIIVRSINTLSFAFNVTEKSWRNHFTFKIIKYILPFADSIIAQSNGMREDLIKSFKINESKIVTIFNPAYNLTEKEINTTENQINENEFLYVGRLSQQKGLTNLIKAFKLAHNNNPEIYLTIVGSGPEKEKLQKLSDELGLNKSVNFEGYQKNTLPFFKRVKATLLTSNYEGFPNVLVESIAVGTPVIAFNCPSGPEDIVITGVNGILVPHLNVNEFSKAIVDVANNKINFNKKEIIETSRKFSLETIVKQYEQILF